MFAGTALVSGQMHAALGFAMAAFAYWRKIGLEEANLRNAFGPEYEAYRRGTRALVPWIL
jgi:protein-S-isoprenylcysteine O-methyltransferase Ste14